MAESPAKNVGLIQASDYVLQQCTLVTSDGQVVDIRSLVITLDLFEDVFSPCMTGSVTLGDALDLPSNLKLHGNEFLSLTIDKPTLGNPIVKTFRCYRLGERNISSNSLQNYTLYFCSEELFLSTQYLVSKSYRGLYIHQMVRDLLTNKLGCDSSKINAIEETAGNFDIIIPRMSALEAIGWLTSRAYNNNRNLFLFFENRDGYNFVSYENLISLTPYDTYTWSLKLDQDPVKNANTFNLIAIAEDYNLIKSMKVGSFSSSLNQYDILNRNYKSTNFSVGQLADSAVLNDTLVGNELKNRFGDSIYSVQENMLKYAIVDDSDPSRNPGKMEKWLPQTASRLGHLNSFKMIVSIPGDINVKAGMTWNVIIPKMQVQDKTTAIDEMRSGKYFVSSVHHRFSEDISTTIVELLSDTINGGMTAPQDSSPTIQSLIQS